MARMPPGKTEGGCVGRRVGGIEEADHRKGRANIADSQLEAAEARRVAVDPKEDVRMLRGDPRQPSVLADCGQAIGPEKLLGIVAAGKHGERRRIAPDQVFAIQPGP